MFKYKVHCRLHVIHTFYPKYYINMNCWIIQTFFVTKEKILCFIKLFPLLDFFLCSCIISSYFVVTQWKLESLGCWDLVAFSGMDYSKCWMTFILSELFVVWLFLPVHKNSRSRGKLPSSSYGPSGTSTCYMLLSVQHSPFLLCVPVVSPVLQ